jgi:asparagine synthetase B (glutamine-hydrolysing)
VAARGERARANAPLVAAFLAGTRYPCLEETFFAGVHPVPPATWCEIPLAGPLAAPRFQPCWSLADHHADARAPEPAYAASLERFGALLRDAVRSHTVADVPAGSLLSGGLDSSALTALLGPAARQAGRRVAHVLVRRARRRAAARRAALRRGGGPRARAGEPPDRPGRRVGAPARG